MTEGPSVGVRTDLHSHLIPGVDDGSRTLEEAMEGVGRMYLSGYRHLVVTPHLDAGLTLDPAALGSRLTEVDEALADLQGAATARWPDLRVSRGHEIRLDHPEPDLADRRLRLADSDVVLVEWPGMMIPPETPSVIRALRAQGVRPLIAHPERYRGYGKSLALVAQWKEEGAFLQMNLGSLTDRYGPAARHNALRLLEYGLVDCLASDFHGRPHLPLLFEEARAAFDQADASTAWGVLCLTNPERILKGESPWSVPPVQPPRGVMDRLRGLFRRAP